MALATVLALAFTPLAAQDFVDKGLKAARAGDFATALREWTPLAEQGHATAQYNLGQMYRLGRGVPQDDAEAVKWYRLAAEQGDASAQNNLGGMYSNGNGVLQSNVMAHMWYNIASANGQESAGERRDDLTKVMTSADISKAQAMASECISSGYSKCGNTAEIPLQVLANDYWQSQRCSGAFGIMTSIGLEDETSPAYQYFSDLADFHAGLFEYYVSQQNGSYVMGDVSKAVSEGLLLVDREAIEDPSSLQANVKHCLSWLNSVQQYFGQQDRDIAISIVMGGMPSPSGTYEYPFSDWTPMIRITELAYELWVGANLREYHRCIASGQKSTMECTLDLSQ